MKISELIAESQVEEGVLGNIAKGAGTALGAVGKGLGAISGAWKGAKDQFQRGQAQGRAYVGGYTPKQPKDTSVRDQEFANQTGKPYKGFKPQTQNTQGGQDPTALRAQANQLIQQADAIEKGQNSQQQKKEAPPPEEQTQDINKQTAPAGPANAADAAKSSDSGAFYGQGATPSPEEQDQDQLARDGAEQQRNENQNQRQLPLEGFHSRFLGMMI